MPAGTDHPVRVRFAPSPTGFLHIGGLRTALYNYLFARHHGGRFILRIEDTDQERYVPEAEPDILNALAWTGLDVDEGPEQGGDAGPYRQSERSELYRQRVQELLDAGHAYYAFDTPEELNAERDRVQAEHGQPFRYDATSRMRMKNALTLPADEVQQRIEAEEPYVVRMKVPEGRKVQFEDRIRGSVAFETSEIDDQVLLKSDGLPTYHLANVVDDHEMRITHVIRGEEWLPSAPKHVLLYEFFGWEPPAMAHLPLIFSPSGGKLSKRNAEQMGIPVNVRDYKSEGYEPEALVNFLAFLGWNPGDERELFTLEELAEAFRLERVGTSGVQFNLDKLRWYNEQYLRQKPAEALAEAARPCLEKRGLEADADYVVQVARLAQERITFPEQIATDFSYFFVAPAEYDEQGIRKRWKDDSADLLTAYAERLEAADAFTEETTEQVLRALAEERGAGAGRLIHPVRLAVSGTTAGPGLFEMLAVLGREEVVKRIRQAVKVLG